MTQDIQTALLTTVNAPYQNQLDASEHTAALKSANVALGQVSSFFTETGVETQKAFAIEHGISANALTHVAGVFEDWSGQSVALIAHSGASAHSFRSIRPPCDGLPRGVDFVFQFWSVSSTLLVGNRSIQVSGPVDNIQQ